MFMIMGVVTHVTILAIVGYFILFSASKADGFVALIGRLLGYWVFLLAILAIVGAVAMHLSGGKLFGMEFPHHGPGMHRWGGPMMPPPPGGPAAPAPAKP